MGSNISTCLKTMKTMDCWGDEIDILVFEQQGSWHETKGCVVNHAAAQKG